MHVQSFTSEKQRFNVTIPRSHVVIHTSEYKKLLSIKHNFEQLKDHSSKKRFAKNASRLIKAYLAITLAGCPGFSITSAGYAIPLFVIGFLHHYDLLYLVSRNEFFTHNFPSDTYLRERITEQATHDIVYLSHELKEKLVFLSCDKGKSTVLKSW